MHLKPKVKKVPGQRPKKAHPVKGHREFGVGVWKSARYIGILSEHDDYHDAEVAAAEAHAANNLGRYQPVALFVPIDIELTEQRCGPLEQVDSPDN